MLSRHLEITFVGQDCAQNPSSSPGASDASMGCIVERSIAHSLRSGSRSANIRPASSRDGPLDSSVVTIGVPGLRTTMSDTLSPGCGASGVNEHQTADALTSQFRGLADYQAAGARSDKDDLLQVLVVQEVGDLLRLRSDSNARAYLMTALPATHLTLVRKQHGLRHANAWLWVSRSNHPEMNHEPKQRLTSLPRLVIHRRTPMDGVRAAEGGG